MAWVVVKTVDAGSGIMLGPIVGPFETYIAGWKWAENAGKYNLNYEKWLVRDLEEPSKL